MSTGKKGNRAAQSQATGTSVEASSGTSLGGTSLGGTSLGGTSLGGTSIGGGTSLGGTSLGGTSLGGSTSLGSPATTSSGTALGGTSLGGTSLGGSTGTALGGTTVGGTSLGGSSGTSLGGTATPATTTGGAKKKGKTPASNTTPTATSTTPEAGTSLGGSGGTALGGTSIGGTALGGTSIGGTALGGTSLGGSSGTPATTGTALGGSGGTALGGTSIGGTALGGTSIGGTALGGSGGTALGGTSIGGTAIGGTALGGSGGTALGGSGGEPADEEDDDEGEEEGGTEGAAKKKKKKKKKPAAAAATPAPAAAAAKPISKQGKAAAAMAAKVKALQLEQEKIKKEAEEIKKREEEEDRKREEAEKKAEEDKAKQQEIKRIQREEAKKKQAEIDAIKKREEAMKKYGLDPNLVAGFGGRGRGARGRGARGGPRGGRGGRGGGKDGARGESDKKDGENEENGNEDQQSETANENSIVSDSNNGNEGASNTGKETEDWEAEDWEVLSEKKPAIEKISKESNTEEEKAKAEEAKKIAEQKKLEEQKKKEEREQEKKRKEEEEHKRKEELERKKEEALAKQQNAQKLRSPIVCVLGHVDTGKTLLLDKIRSSNIQAGEAGGITQQIGATYFPNDVIRAKTKDLTENLKTKLSFKLPGLLIIDTPGHESFSNLRSRGSSLCDIAILVIDIMHGLEPQTRESIRLLKNRNTPFIVALNKVDRVFGWQSTPNGAFQTSLAKQDQATKQRFEERAKFTVADLAGEGLNSTLYYQNKDFKKTVSLVPTSAITGEGIPDLLMLLVQLSQSMMGDKLLELSELDCTVLEVKKLAGRGTTLDVILANGVLRQNDKIVVCGINGEPIVTHIRTILTPPLMGEMRSKNTTDLVSNKEVRAAIGCKIDAPGLDDAVAGSQLFVVKPGEDIEKYKAEVMSALNILEGKVDKSGFGVYVQSSTLGSMEALLEFLKEVCKIPVSGIRIGPVHKRDVMRSSVMLEHKKEFACILAFDVKVMPDAREFAEKLGVRIFEADIIYHLEEMFQKYLEEIASEKKTNLADQVVFPCILTILPDHIYKTRNPIVLGVKVDDGILKVGTPIVVPSQNKIELGVIKGIRKTDQTEVQEARAGDEVSIEIQPDASKQKFMYARHFTEADKLVSLLSRHSIDALKESHPEVCKTKEIFKLIQEIKKLLGVM